MQVLRSGVAREWAAQLAVTAAKAQAETGDTDGSRATLKVLHDALDSPADRATIARYELSVGLVVSCADIHCVALAHGGRA